MLSDDLKTWVDWKEVNKSDSSVNMDTLAYIMSVIIGSRIKDVMLSKFNRREPLVGNEGKLHKRINKFLWNEFNFKISPEYLSYLCTTANQRGELQHDALKATGDINWNRGDYESINSCFWTCHSKAKYFLKEQGLMALLANQKGKGIGRCWILNSNAMEEDHLVCFNAYPGANYLPTYADEITAYLNTIPREEKIVCKQVQLTNRGSSSSWLYINHGKGFIIGTESVVNSIDSSLNMHYNSPGASELDLYVGKCSRCGYIAWSDRDHAKYSGLDTLSDVLKGSPLSSDERCYCEYCVDKCLVTCEICGDRVPDGSLLRYNNRSHCSKCFRKADKEETFQSYYINGNIITDENHTFMKLKENEYFVTSTDIKKDRWYGEGTFSSNNNCMLDIKYHKDIEPVYLDSTYVELDCYNISCIGSSNAHMPSMYLGIERGVNSLLRKKDRAKYSDEYVTHLKYHLEQLTNLLEKGEIQDDTTVTTSTATATILTV